MAGRDRSGYSDHETIAALSPTVNGASCALRPTARGFDVNLRCVEDRQRRLKLLGILSRREIDDVEVERELAFTTLGFAQ
jgi:hypothetical protein